MYRDHTLEYRGVNPSPSHQAKVYSTLLALREAVCRKTDQTSSGTKTCRTAEGHLEVCLLQNEERKPPTCPSHEPQHPASRTEKESPQQSSEATPTLSHPSLSTGTGRRSLAQGVAMANRQHSQVPTSEEDEEEDEPDRQQLPGI